MMSDFIQSYNTAKDLALKAIKNGSNIVIGGTPCTGKQHLLRELCSELKLSSQGYCFHTEFGMTMRRQVISLMKTQKWILTTNDSTSFRNFAESYEIPNAVIIDMDIRVPWSIIGTDYPELPRDMECFGVVMRKIDNFKRKQVKYACVLLMCCERMNHRENKIRQQFDFGKGYAKIN